MQDDGCRMMDAGCRMQDAGCRMQDAGCRMQDAGCMFVLFTTATACATFAPATFANCHRVCHFTFRPTTNSPPLSLDFLVLPTLLACPP